MQELLDHMCRRVLRHADGIHLTTPLPRVGLGVLRQRSVPVMTLCEPMICMVLQGAKQVLVGNRLLRYDAASCFAASVELPATGCVLEADPNRPYIAVSLALDPVALSALLSDLAPVPVSAAGPGFGVAPVSRALLEAWDHHLALLDKPEDIRVLAAQREREVLYRLLQSEHGPMLWQMAREESRLSQVRRAVDWISQHFDETLRIETLADIAGMSIPSFHRHFKAATAMSPLQYQKTLRLQAARRMLVTNSDAARTAYAVGYESASQFSREYSRLFGIPPAQDAAQMRSGVGETSVVMI